MSLHQYHSGESSWIQHTNIEKVEASTPLRPGDEVRHVLNGGYGVVVAASQDEAEITVLWSDEPHKWKHGQGTLEDFAAMHGTKLK